MTASAIVGRSSGRVIFQNVVQPDAPVRYSSTP